MKVLSTLIASFALLTMGCATQTPPYSRDNVSDATVQAAKAPLAEASMEAKNNSKASGKVEFEETAAGLKVSYDLKGLAKNATHGFHVHEKGDCSSHDAKSAGTHYAPTNEPGGTSLDTPNRFLGDMPQIKSDASGMAKGSFTVPNLTIKEGEHPIDGKAVILHGGPDNPKKKSAPRIACGVVKTKS